MTLPADLHTVIVTGTVADAGGNGLVSLVSFVPTTPLTDVTGRLSVYPAGGVYQLAAGALATDPLVPTDATTVAPVGEWAYTVTVAPKGSRSWSFTTLIPASPFSFTATNASPCVFTATGSAYTNGAAVKLTGGSIPAGFTAGTTYYVVSASGTTFGLAATSGGSAIGSTSTGSGTVSTASIDLSALTPVSSPGTPSPFLPEAGGTMSGTAVLSGSPPLAISAGAGAGKVLTSDNSGNITLQAAAGAEVVTSITAAGASAGTADNGRFINTAIAALPSSGGVIYIPPGTFTYSTPISLAGKTSVTLQGATVPGAGASMTSTLTYTGTGSASAISLQNSNGVVLRNLTLLYSSSSFTGRLTDWRNVSGSDTSYGLLEDCYLGGGSGITTAQSLVNLDKCINMTIRKCSFAGAVYAIYGRSVSGNYSNAVQIENCVFHGQLTAHVWNPGQGWKISGCTFEALSGGTSGALGHDSGVNADGLTVQSCWTGDGTGGTQFTVAGSAVSFLGNWIGCTSGVAIYTDDVVVGLAVIGNDYQGASVALKTVQPSGSSSALGWVILANTYTSVTAKLSGNFAGSTIYHDGTTSGLAIYGASVNGALTMTDGQNIPVATTTGTKIGTSTSQKIGFWNAAPVIQQTVSGSTVSAALTSLLTALANAGLVNNATSTFASSINDPLDYGICRNFDPVSSAAVTTLPSSPQSWYSRLRSGGYAMSNAVLWCTTSSGNISAAVYANSGAGASAAPTGGQLANTGAIACPAAGQAVIALGSSVTPNIGDWTGLSADNITAAFYGLNTGVSSAITAGFNYVQAIHPLPSSPSSLTAGGNNKIFFTAGS